MEELHEARLELLTQLDFAGCWLLLVAAASTLQGIGRDHVVPCLFKNTNIM